MVGGGEVGLSCRSRYDAHPSNDVSTGHFHKGCLKRSIMPCFMTCFSEGDDSTVTFVSVSLSLSCHSLFSSLSSDVLKSFSAFAVSRAVSFRHRR